jgi:hypothetical protein
MDTVFANRPYEPDDWDRLHVYAAKNELPPGFITCERFDGYPAGWLIRELSDEYECYVSFAKTVLQDFAHEALHAEPFASLAHEYIEEIAK